MNPRSALLMLLALVATPLLAGCASQEEPVQAAALKDGEAPAQRPQLQADRGAIAGLLVDDRFRPIPDGLILLQETGQTTRSNLNGEFAFTDLPAGAYTLRVTAEGHEAPPKQVAVAAGQYAEIDVTARRVVSTEGTIITQEYTVFIACSIDFVVNGIAGGDCIGDLSGDSGRSGFTSNYTHLANVTYVVTEMRTNQEGRWEVQVRAANATCDCTNRYGVAQFQGDYVKIVNKIGEKNAEHEAAASYGENVPMDNLWELQTILFADNPGREELQGAGLPVCCGVGATFGIKARFVQSVFIGPPEVDIASYSAL